jgi:hypothetical protein
MHPGHYTMNAADLYRWAMALPPKSAVAGGAIRCIGVLPIETFGFNDCVVAQGPMERPMAVLTHDLRALWKTDG